MLLGAAALGLIGGFFLPNAVAGIMDTRRLDAVVSVDALSISLDVEPVLSLPRRIALAASPHTETLGLSAGQGMEAETAKAVAVRELARLCSGTVFESAENGYVVENASVVLVIDSNNPSISLIIWEFRIIDQYMSEAIVTLDDETGMILKLIYRYRGGTGAQQESAGESFPSLYGGDMSEAAQELVEMLSEYYGIAVSLGDYQLIGNIAYYRADMHSGSLLIPMYGIIRTTGFTFNERI